MQGDLNGMWHVPIPNLLILNSGPLQDLNITTHLRYPESESRTPLTPQP